MAISAVHNEVPFGVGDTVRVNQEISEGEKSRIQTFEGMVIAIKGRGMGKSFTVRRIGAQQVGIEKIFPIHSPIVKSVEVAKKAVRGTRRAKLYYIRNKSRREISKIVSRSNKKNAQIDKQVEVKKEVPSKKVQAESKKSTKTADAPKKEK